jgi:hypothetical protein
MLDGWRYGGHPIAVTIVESPARTIASGRRLSLTCAPIPRGVGFRRSLGDERPQMTWVVLGVRVTFFLSGLGIGVLKLLEFFVVPLGYRLKRVPIRVALGRSP